MESAVFGWRAFFISYWLFGNKAVNLCRMNIN